MKHIPTILAGLILGPFICAYLAIMCVLILCGVEFDL
jgi:hypothetical protein